MSKRVDGDPEIDRLVVQSFKEYVAHSVKFLKMALDESIYRNLDLEALLSLETEWNKFGVETQPQISALIQKYIHIRKQQSSTWRDQNVDTGPTVIKPDQALTQLENLLKF